MPFTPLDWISYQFRRTYFYSTYKAYTTFSTAHPASKRYNDRVTTTPTINDGSSR